MSAIANIDAENADNFEDVSLPCRDCEAAQVLIPSFSRLRSSLLSRVSFNRPSRIVPSLTGHPVVQHMETYWSILEKIRGSKLRLTKYDDEIYEHFKKDFPEFDASATINEDDMKSKQGKERWRKFISEYEQKVDDYNFGTMLRANPKSEYGEKDTIFGRSGALRL